MFDTFPAWRMRHGRRALVTTWLAVSLFFSPAALADCATPAEAWITLEIVAPLPKGNQAAEWVEVDRRGCVTTGYAAFDRRAGIYQRQLDEIELGTLTAAIARSEVQTFDARKIHAEIAAKAQAVTKATGTPPPTFLVADADRYRLKLSTSGKDTLVSFDAPKQVAAHHKSIVALNRLVELIETLQDIGGDPRKVGVTP